MSMIEQQPRRRRRVSGFVIAAAVVVLLVVVVVIADIALRAYAENRARAEITSSLPDTIDGDVDVTIGGFSFLQQYLSGTFDEVTLDAPALSVDGVPVAAHVDLTGVPTDFAKPVGGVTAELSLSEDAVNSLIEVPGSATLTLENQAVGYDGSISFLGLSLGYLVTAGVSVTADEVVLSPQTAKLTAGSSVVDASDALNAVLSDSIPLCVANYLPQGVELTSLAVVPGSATVTLGASDFTLDEASLRSVGTCP
jgi:hypothetical protein